MKGVAQDLDKKLPVMRLGPCAGSVAQSWASQLDPVSV